MLTTNSVWRPSLPLVLIFCPSRLKLTTKRLPYKYSLVPFDANLLTSRFGIPQAKSGSKVSVLLSTEVPMELPLFSMFPVRTLLMHYCNGKMPF
jgi:hypothetical protein